MLWTKGFLGNFHDFRRFMSRVSESMIAYVVVISFFVIAHLNL